ncbi:vegetative cell wall protein gp1-like [Amphibalanus amphitrite]|uniref:vegetative cell wall protein gp1-like n=1 Tax=Amphibalanus amphitrite TaxID=1232801 RepID=UPI001C90A54A|nr:vegetative cell wall protein gp1-like [Amphibalanus amphitrite]
MSHPLPCLLLLSLRIWRRHGDQLRRRQSAEPIGPPEAASREVRRPSSDAAVQPGRPGGASQGATPPAPLSSAVRPSQSRPGALTQQPPQPNVRSSPTQPGVPAQSSHRPSPVSAPSSLEPGGPPRPSADVWPSSAPGTCPAPSSPDGTGPHPEVATSVERTLRRSTRTRRAPELYQAGSGM